MIVAALAGGGWIWTHRASHAAATPAPVHAAARAMPLTNLTGAQLLARMKAAMTTAGSTHYVIDPGPTAPGSGGTGDAGPTSGHQTFQFGAAQYEVLVAGPYAYVRGNQAGIANLTDLTPAVKASLGTNWLRVQPGQPGYADFSADVTLPSLQADAFDIAGPITRLPATTKVGQQVIGISGAGAGPSAAPGETEVVWISLRTALPVEYASTDQGSTATTTFSRWGQPLDEKPPASFKTLSGGTPA